ncbi:MAG TPA: RluA family pseudouridine synthase [Nodosilinea sp.]|nr:RluA family pseudouridine synthase [Nodosilinea sp.]
MLTSLALSDPPLHSLASFGPLASPDEADEADDYHYQGYCPRTGQRYRLPRTAQARAVARGLMAQLQGLELGEGKMYGVLLVQTPTGQTAVLKAFSGLWRGQAQVPGWVPVIPGRQRVALQEARTLDRLETLKARLQELAQRPERQRLAELEAEAARERQILNGQWRDRRCDRSRQRHTLAATLTGEALTTALAALDQASRRDQAERRQVKQRWRDRLAPLAAATAATDAEIAALKQQRRDLSRQLQADLHAAATLTNFAGESLAIQALAGAASLPTGTGDCCAPKLLHAAAQHGLRPLALAEFWWGPAQGDRRPGEFYGACAERCQPIMGFLLSGLSAQVLGQVLGQVEGATPQPLPILYRDDWLLAVDKPAGLLSVPGRYCDRTDSALTRLALTLPPGAFLRPVHRLDQDTSGVLLLALDGETHRQLSQQFAQRQVHKTYQALLSGPVSEQAGTIDLPLWGDPAQRPRQTVDRQRGKPSQTRFEVLSGQGPCPRVVFYPITGRTHQLRVHAAHPQGLNAPIVGDRLYGSPGQRLYLHAHTLGVTHPHRSTALNLSAPLPF